MEVPEVAIYPDSGKYGVYAGTPPGRPPTGDTIRRIYRMEDDVNYWDDEN